MAKKTRTTNKEGRLRKQGVDLVASWRADWCKFAREALGVNLDEEQQAILRSVQHNPRTSVASGTARGKDFVAACAAVCFLYLTPRWNAEGELIENTKVALTAPTDRQVKNIMMPEVARLFNRARRRGVDLPGRLNAYDIRTSNDEWFLTGFKADEHNHEAWSGFHAVHTMFIITEASGIGEDTFAAIEGNLQGDSRILLVFNPNTTTGYAARSHKGDRWAKFRLNSLTAPNVREKRVVIPGQVDYAWVVDKLREWCTPIDERDRAEEQDDFCFEGRWYRPEDLFRKKVLGCFPKVGDDVLIPQQWIDLAVERWRRAGSQEPPAYEQRILGVDVAGMGRDSSCFCERKGNYVLPLDCRNSGGRADHMAVAGEVHARRRREPNLIVSIDTIGEGAGVYSRLEELGGDSRLLISCKYSAGAKIRDRDLTDVTGQYRFANLRAYLFWAVRDWLDPKNDTGAMLPPDDQLAEEMSEVRWSFRSDGRVLIEKKDEIKKRLGRSPDRFDALANTFYPTHAVTGGRIDLARLSTLV